MSQKTVGRGLKQEIKMHLGRQPSSSYIFKQEAEIC